MTISEADLNDTPETAPAIARTTTSINKAKAREMRDSPVFKKLKSEFREQGARFRHPDGRIGADCWICNSAIDFKLAYPHPMSWSLDHAITVKERPELLCDPLNFRHSHLDCNLVRGTDEPGIDIGEPSEVW
jgi:hypothetical protein